MDTVKTAQGIVSGAQENGVLSFKGIPYAKPPLGELRFTPPNEAEPWTGVRECIAYGPCATQADSILVNNETSEDCLYLNIWTPNVSGKLPVYFWIHGGGFFTGCGSMEYYNGSYFAQQDIVVVTINYRLGALGFLAFNTLLQQYGTTGNWGTLDQIAALKWVRQNIAAFGGDPDNITIGGESAGAFSVSNLVMSPLTKGLFRRAIMQSGTLLSNRVAVPHTESALQKSIAMSTDYAASLGAEDTPAGLKKLREMDAMQLWQTGYFSSDATDVCPYAFWSTLDGTVLPKDPFREIQDGNYNKGDFLIGYNKDEGAAFIPDETSPDRIENFFNRIFTSEDLRRIQTIFDDIYSIKTARDIVTNIYFKAGMTMMKNTFSEQGNPVYAYEFDFTPDGNYPLSFMGAHHASEIPFIFGTSEHVGVHYSEAGKELERMMHFSWANFIKTGNPNGNLPIKWKRYRASAPNICLFDRPISCKEDLSQNTIQAFAQILH